VERQRAAAMHHQVLALAEFNLLAAQRPRSAGLVDRVHPLPLPWP
jgi:hypothetical protein